MLKEIQTARLGEERKGEHSRGRAQGPRVAKDLVRAIKM